jgi:tRNA A-37 threonylcarbamoyl transferase component Bud32
MSEAVLDAAIEQIADGLTVDWNAIDKAAPAREGEWAKSLRVLNDIVNLHREAAVDYEHTTLVSAGPAHHSSAPALDTWGKYRLANKVGEGSYGSVYLAWDSELERDVAIKILHRRVGDTRLKDRLLQEGRALAKIRHNNVVNVHGVEAHGDRVGLCMEFVRGKTLADIVRGQGKMSAAEAVLIGEDLCRALSAVHRAGYVHRDVKAKNVMRDDSGRIVLMDFGTGRTMAQEGKSDRAGTPLYMAPEVIEGGQASARSDVYSLGVLLYHLVTGDYPVRADSVEELRDAHANRRHRWLSEVRPDLPVAFMQVIERAIALDPEERYANASELLAALSGLKIGARSWVWRLAKPVLIAAAALTGMVTLGAITSTHFNLALQRSDFAQETVWTWLVWGRRTSIPPFLILLMIFFGGAVLAVIRRLALATSGNARSFDVSIRRRVGVLVHRFRLDEVPVLASYALLVSAAALVVAWWYYMPLILALLSYVPSAAAGDVALFSPDFVTYHNYYRGTFSFVVIIAVAVWYPVSRLVKKGQSPPWGLVAGGAVALCVALALLHLPYRLLYFTLNEPFEAARWNGTECSVIGEDGERVLLFCPRLDAPRNRVVKRGDSSLELLGLRKNIFSPLSKQASRE